MDGVRSSARLGVGRINVREALVRCVCILASGLVAACGGGQSSVPQAPATSVPRGEIVVTRTATGGTTDLHVLAADGTSDHLLARNASAAAPAPDGDTVAFVRQGAIWVMRRDGSAQRQVTQPASEGARAADASTATPGEHVVSDADPAWSHGGSTVYFSRMRWKEMTSSLFEVDVTSGRTRELTEPAGAVRGTGGYGTCQTQPAPTPPPRAIVAYGVVSDCVHGSEMFIDAVTVRGRRADVGVRFPRSTSAVEFLIGAPAWAPDGGALAYIVDDLEAWTEVLPGRGAAGVYVSLTDGSSPRRLAEPGDGQDVADPAWSPDGHWLAFTGLEDVGGSEMVFVVRRDGSRLRRVSASSAHDREPAWLPDRTAKAP
jgi:dipeptidyl aminopeptidase/acylaminoacyl peptidase